MAEVRLALMIYRVATMLGWLIFAGSSFFAYRSYKKLEALTTGIVRSDR